jgi:dynein heavy chain
MYGTPHEISAPKSQILDPFDLDYINVAKQLTPERRYWYYVEKGIPAEAVPDMEGNVIRQVERFIPTRILNAEHLQKTRKTALEEIRLVHNIALRKSIVDYILMDGDERIRLGIPAFEAPFEPQIVRAPVPWHHTLIETRASVEQNLYITNPVMLELLNIHHQFSGIKLIDMTVFSENMLPTSTEQFQTILKSQCQAFKARLLNEYE